MIYKSRKTVEAMQLTETNHAEVIRWLEDWFGCTDAHSWGDGVWFDRKPREYYALLGDFIVFDNGEISLYTEKGFFEDFEPETPRLAEGMVSFTV